MSLKFSTYIYIYMKEYPKSLKKCFENQITGVWGKVWFNSEKYFLMSLKNSIYIYMGEYPNN